MSNLLRNKNIYTAPAAVVLALGATACSATETGPVGELDKSIVRINIEEGANIRTSPETSSVYDSNLAIKAPEAISIDTLGGARVDTDENGTWYGFGQSSEAAQNNPELKEAFKEDSDETLWVNEQGAETETKAQ